MELPREARLVDRFTGLHVHVSLQRRHRAHRDDQPYSSGRVLAAREATAALLRPTLVLATGMQLRDADDGAVQLGVDRAPPRVAIV